MEMKDPAIMVANFGLIGIQTFIVQSCDAFHPLLDMNKICIGILLKHLCLKDKIITYNTILYLTVLRH